LAKRSNFGHLGGSHPISKNASSGTLNAQVTPKDLLINIF
jgi:hypothetical protein